MAHSWSETTLIDDVDPASGKLTITMSESFSREDWDVRVDAALRFALTREEFNVSGEVRAFETDREIAVREWTQTVPRRLL